MKRYLSLIISAALIFGTASAVCAAEEPAPEENVSEAAEETKIQYKDLGEKEYEISEDLTITDAEEADAFLFNLQMSNSILKIDGDNIDIDFAETGKKDLTITINREDGKFGYLSFIPYEPGSLSIMLKPEAIDYYFEDNAAPEGLESISYFSNLKISYYPGPEDLGIPDDDGMFKITAQGCVGYVDGKPITDYRAVTGTKLTFDLGRELKENETLNWVVQYPSNNHFRNFDVSEDGLSISLEMPLNDIIVTAEMGEIIPPEEINQTDDIILPFKDVKESKWFYEDVKEMFEKGLMSGMSDNEFGPAVSTERAMILSILYRMEGSPKVEGKIEYSDIKAGKWYTDAVIWASQNGIASGYPDGTFKPDKEVSRQELAQFIYKYVQYKGHGFVGMWYFPLNFADIDQLGSWADEAMHWCVMNEIIAGMGSNMLAPKETCTRAQLAAILNRLSKIDLSPAPEPIPVPEPITEPEEEEVPAEEVPAEEAPAQEMPEDGDSEGEVPAGEVSEVREGSDESSDEEEGPAADVPSVGAGLRGGNDSNGGSGGGSGSGGKWEEVPKNDGIEDEIEIHRR